MKDIKISVVVPVYNVEKYMEKSIDSILNQTFNQFEIILIDDGSTDSSGTKCDEYAKRDQRIKVIHKKNGGLMSAWMRGVEQSLAEYIVFVDSDDWIEPRMLQYMWEEKERNHSDMVVCNFCKEQGQKKYRHSFLFLAGYYDRERCVNEIYDKMLNAGDFQLRGIPTSRWGKLIKKSIILDNIHYCDTRVSYSEDLNIMFPVFLDCNSLSIIDDVETDYNYRMNPMSILHTYNKTMYRQITLVYDKLFQCCRDKGKQEVFEKQLYADYLAAIVQCYKNELMNEGTFDEIKDNILPLVQDEYFLYATSIVEWRKYRKLNVLIIWCMKHWNWFTCNVITYFLFLLKSYKVKELKRVSSR